MFVLVVSRPICVETRGGDDATMRMGFRTRSGGTRLIGPKTRKQGGQHLPEDGGEMGSTRIMV